MSDQVIQIINQEHEVFGKVRTLIIDGEPWFFAVDVAKALGYKNTKQAIIDHCDYAKNLNDFRGHKTRPFEIIDELGNSYSKIGYAPKVIPEADVYSLIFKSKLKGAKKFKRWVVTEVLPSIRRYGAYIAGENDFSLFPNILPAHDAAIKLAKIYGYKGNQAVLTANKMLKRAHGVDVQELMGGANLLSDKNEKLLTPTQIGKLVGESAISVNKILRGLGLQKQIHTFSGKKEYKITSRGKEYATYLDVGKEHSDGTPIQQIKWYESTVPLVVDFIESQ